MKLIVAFVQPFMAPKIVSALHEVAGLSGATFTDVRGFGRGRAGGLSDVTDEELVGTLPKVRLEAAVSDGIAERVVRVIREAAHTGNRGDGKVYVLPIERAVRISTGEEGEAGI